MRAMLLTIAALLCSCDEGSSGLQQRLLEMEAERDVQSKKVEALQSQLNSLTEKQTVPPPDAAEKAAGVNNASSSDHATLIAAASSFGEALAKEMPGGHCKPSG